MVELENFPSKMIDENEVKYYFEARKRKAIEEIIKANMRIKTPGKGSATKKMRSQTNFGKVSPVFSSRHTPAKQVFVRTPLGSRSPMSKSFYREEIIHKSPNAKISVTSRILTIEELLDVSFIVPPSYVTSRINSRINSAMATPSKNSANRVIDFRTSKDSPDSWLRKRGQPANDMYPKFDEITTGLRKGLISWGQLQFSKEAVNYLQRNIHILDQ